MTQRIKSITKGWGAGSQYWTTDPKISPEHLNRVDRIEVGQQPYLLSESDNGRVDIVVYRGFRGAIIVFEIEAGSGITLTF